MIRDAATTLDVDSHWYSASLHLSALFALFFSCPRAQLLLLAYFWHYSPNHMLRQLVRYSRFKHPEKPTTIVRPFTAFLNDEYGPVNWHIQHVSRWDRVSRFWRAWTRRDILLVLVDGLLDSCCIRPYLSSSLELRRTVMRYSTELCA